uniref:Uncharacterized protein n=1 Tax=Timema monikensis TaxID=170555 RepID=A0A7R9HTB3_9NEOP|nr:unnamed protein product [Timema monikensis]
MDDLQFNVGEAWHSPHSQDVLSEVKEGFGNQINLCRNRGLNPGPPAQKSDTLPLDPRGKFGPDIFHPLQVSARLFVQDRGLVGRCTNTTFPPASPSVHHPTRHFRRQQTRSRQPTCTRDGESGICIPAGRIESTIMKLSSWVDELRQELQSDEVADTLEAAERLVEQCGQQRDSSLDASVSTIAQGETLLQELRENTAKEIKKDMVGTDNSKYASERRRMREELRKMKTFY